MSVRGVAIAAQGAHGEAGGHGRGAPGAEQPDHGGGGCAEEELAAAEPWVTREARRSAEGRTLAQGEDVLLGDPGAGRALLFPTHG
ncbi:hypothetical protein ACFQ6Q_17580 [Streptomyces sp. NPDC056437]|uniref:hypothetical protein n=1 Tax=Streptomyces sp. NPDC056437 TaxID=3345816 RepID=UPI00368E32B2